MSDEMRRALEAAEKAAGEGIKIHIEVDGLSKKSVRISAERPAEKDAEDAYAFSSPIRSSGDEKTIYVSAGKTAMGEVVQEGGEADFEALIREACLMGELLAEVPREEKMEEKTEEKTGRPARITDLGCAGNYEEVSYEEMEAASKRILKEIAGSLDQIPVKMSAEVQERIREAVVVTERFSASERSGSFKITVGWGENSYMTTAKELGKADLQDLILRIKQGEDLAGDIPAISMQGGEYRAVLSGSFMCTLFKTAWMSFAERRVKTSGSPFAGDMGKVCASDKVTLFDLPETDKGGFVRRMDTAGVIDKAYYPVKNGILQEWIGAEGRNVSLVRSYARNTVPRNFGLERGETALHEMLSEGEIAYILDSPDPYHSLDPVSGIFHFPVYGVMMKDGKPAGRFSSCNVEGDLKDLLMNIEKVGNVMSEDVLDILESYLLTSPDVLVKKIRITGS